MTPVLGGSDTLRKTGLPDKTPALEKQQMKPKGLFISIRLKLFLVFALLVTIVLGATFFWLYNLFTDMTTHALQADVDAMLDSSTDALDGDQIAGLIADPQIDDSKDWPDNMIDARYQEVADWFDQASIYNPRAYPYLYYESAPGELSVLVDSISVQDPQDPQGYQFGDQLIDIESDNFMLRGLKQKTIDLDLYVDREGTWVAGAAPIKDSSGKVVAAVAVDVAASDVVQGQLNLRNALLPIFGGVYLLLFLAVWLIAGGMTRSIRALDEASRQVSEGTYTPVNLKSGLIYDEIQRFGLTFNQMVEKVRGREETLREQVKKLTIQIDETKRKKAVDDVVGSEFFQDLKSKAQDMRERHSDEERKES